MCAIQIASTPIIRSCRTSWTLYRPCPCFHHAAPQHAPAPMPPSHPRHTWLWSFQGVQNPMESCILATFIDLPSMPYMPCPRSGTQSCLGPSPMRSCHYHMPCHLPTPHLYNHILPQPMSVHAPPLLLIAHAMLGLISMPRRLVQAAYWSSSLSCVSAHIHIPHARVHGVSSQACILATPELGVHTCHQLPSMCHVPHLSSTLFAAHSACLWHM